MTPDPKYTERLIAKTIDFSKLQFTISPNCRKDLGYSIDVGIEPYFTKTEAELVIKQLRKIIKSWWTDASRSNSPQGKCQA